jgi:RNA polymerase sigma factor (sigma-70 family)
MTYPETRNKMVVDNMDLVHRIAGRIKARLPRRVQLSDLIGDGYIGLIDAASKYSEDRGTPFRTYAGFRIVGAILDALRRNDILSRGARRRANDKASTVPPPRFVSIDYDVSDREPWAEALADPAPPVDSVMMRDEFPDRFVRSLQKSERQVLTLCFVKSYTTQLAAKHLGLSARSILAIRSRLLERAKSYYTNERGE